jgi:hypothetical protein
MDARVASGTSCQPHRRTDDLMSHLFGQKTVTIEKRAQKKRTLDAEELELFQLCIDGYSFGSDRLFEGPIVQTVHEHGEGRFAAVVERRMSGEEPIGESRLVLVDRELKTQWVSPWVSWGKFCDIEVAENAADASLWSKAWNRLLRIRGRLRFQVVRPHRTFSYPVSYFLLPFPADQCVPLGDPVPSNLEPGWTQSAVSFDSVRLKVKEEPGPQLSEENWRDVTQISIQREVGRGYQWTQIKIWGKQAHSVDLPCEGAQRFLREIERRYGIDEAKIRNVAESDVSASQLLWTSLEVSRDEIQVKDIRPLRQDEFEDGLTLTTGERILWANALEDLLAKSLVRLNDKGPVPVYETISPVQLGPWLLPRLWTYPNSLESPKWIPESWSVEFLAFSPELTVKQLDRCLTALAEGKEYSFYPESQEYFIIGSNICFALNRRGGIWRLSVDVAYGPYWEHMRRRHPLTRTLKIDRFLNFDASTSTVGKGRFIVSEFKDPDTIPTPKSLANSPLSFWEDAANGLQGIGSYVTSHYWNKGELEDLDLRTTTYPGDRGNFYEETILTVHFKTRGRLCASFAGTLSFSLASVLDWAR